MADVSYIRGNLIQFSTTFSDVNGNPVAPDSASVEIRTAPLEADPITVVIPMSNSGGTWTAEWNTTGVAPGLVYWCITSINPPGADQGTFDLIANWANP